MLAGQLGQVVKDSGACQAGAQEAASGRCLQGRCSRTQPHGQVLAKHSGARQASAHTGQVLGLAANAHIGAGA